jgi:hypothetical protein
MATGRNPVPAFSPLRGRTACTNGGHAEVADDRIAVRHFPPGYARAPRRPGPRVGAADEPLER